MLSFRGEGLVFVFCVCVWGSVGGMAVSILDGLEGG